MGAAVGDAEAGKARRGTLISLASEKLLPKPSEGSPLLPTARNARAVHLRHPMLGRKYTNIALDDFTHQPELYAKAMPDPNSDRTLRASARLGVSKSHDTSIKYAVGSVCLGSMRSATVFGHARLPLVLLGHLLFCGTLACVYTFALHHKLNADYVSGIKDFVDLCVSGIIFLLGGFVVTMLNRWWFVRTNCVGGLVQSLSNLCLIATAVWSTPDPADREARQLVARYSLLAFCLLFAEAQEHDMDAPSLEMATRLESLEASGLLLPAEASVLKGLPGKTTAALTWLASFWETAFNPKSGKACSKRIAARNCDNGRYAAVFGQLFLARQHVVETDAYLNTPLPYGYMHLILIVVHATCLANSIFCGISLGTMAREVIDDGSGPEAWVPFVFVRLLRIAFIPVLLDGMLIVCDVIANPMGDDKDDLPAGALLEHMEDEILVSMHAVEKAHPAATLMAADD